MYLLDTNICIYIINNKNPNTIRKLSLKNRSIIAISVITVSELIYGCEKSRHQEQNYIKVSEFLTEFNLLNFTSKDALINGQIRGELAKKRRPIGQFDSLIAAQALSNDLVLVTNNIREFKRVRELRLENWAA